MAPVARNPPQCPKEHRGDDRHPLTVAGAATVSAPIGSSSPCSLLIPAMSMVGEPSASGLCAADNQVKQAGGERADFDMRPHMTGLARHAEATHAFHRDQQFTAQIGFETPRRFKGDRLQKSPARSSTASDMSQNQYASPNGTLACDAPRRGHSPHRGGDLRRLINRSGLRSIAKSLKEWCARKDSNL